MFNILTILLSIIYHAKCNNQQNYDLNLIFNEDKNIDPGISKTYFIEYNKETNFIFNISGEDILQINIHGINCNFELDFEGDLINQYNLDTYSFTIDSGNKTIKIKPLLDKIDGKYKENYESKSCPLSINSFSIKNNQQPKVKIENKEDSWFYFKSGNINYLYKYNFHILIFLH